jgi:dihydroxyacid dehydratase/phosphogluconate dehydratase
MFIRLVSGQHIVIGGDNSDVVAQHALQRRFIMCDGVTQGQDGMELSLLSREVIAMSAAIGLSHNMFDRSARLYG